MNQQYGEVDSADVAFFARRGYRSTGRGIFFRYTRTQQTDSCL
jgi:hypothetical protein